MKYTTTFSSTIKPLVSEEKDKYLAMASLIDVGEFIPDIDTDKNIDLLPIAFNACVANRVNKNGDVIDTATATEICNHFVNKPINLEHNRQRVVGTILAAGFSEFGTDRPITAEEAEKNNGPFNITLGGVVWKVVNSDLADMIEDSNDPTSEYYRKISASWELGFSDYHLVVLEAGQKNIENGKTISIPEEIEELQENLRVFGGTGELENGTFIYRKVVEQVVPLGIGLTESPAADVQGVAVKEEEDDETKADEKAGYPPNCKPGYEEKDGKCVKTKSKDTGSKQTDKTSLSNSNNVNITKDVVMKITSLKDINDESLKTLEATAIHDYIQEELRKASEEFSAEKVEKENALKDTKEQLDSLSEEHNKVKEELAKVNTNLEALEAEKAAKEAEELFNQRMASFDEEYELTDEDRKIIASDIKEFDEETFNSYQEKMTVLLRDKNKETLAEQAKTEEAKAEEVKEETAEVVAEEPKAEEAEEVVEEALNNAEVDEDTVATSTEAEQPTLYDKYKDAFSLDNFNIS